MISTIVDYLLNSHLFQIIAFSLVGSVVILVIILFWLNKKYFEDLFTVSRNTKIVLLILLFGFSLLITTFGFNFSSYIPSDEDWELLVFAKNLLNKGLVINHLRYGLLYPFFLAIGFWIFGTNYLVASVMNFIFGVLSIILVFAVTQLIFKNEKISLTTTSIYTFTPLVFMFTGYWMGFPMMLNFFLLLFVLTSILFFKYHKTSLLILSLLLFVLTSQIKPEYFILIIPFTFYFLIYREYKNISAKKLLIIGLILCIFLIPYFVQNLRLKEGYNSINFCGNVSQITENAIVYTPLSKYIDPVLKKLINNRFSLNYLLGDIPNFIKFWSSESLVFVSLLILIGILASLKRYFKETIFIVLIFLSISLLYLTDCALLEKRYLFPTFALIIVFFGYGVSFITRIIKQFIIKRPNAIIEIILINTILIALFTYWYLNDYRSGILQIKFHNYKIIENQKIYTDYERIKIDLSKVPKEDSYIFVPHPVEQDIMRFLNYNGRAIINVEDFQQFDKIDFKTAKLPLEDGYDNYFIETWYCDTFSAPICQFIKEKYNLTLIKQVGEDSIYYINDK